MLVSWQYPGPKIAAQNYFALNYGFANIFGIPENVGHIFLIPSTLAAVSMGIHFLCVIVRSMSESGLLPSIFNVRSRNGNVPFVALTFVVLGSVLVTLFQVMALLWNPIMASVVVIMVQYCHYFNYLCIFASYLLFRQEYDGRKHYSFHSPLGIYGAYIGIGTTLLMFLFNVFPWYNYMGYSLGGFLFIFFVSSVGYVLYASGNQRFSLEEERVFFIAYIIRGKMKFFFDVRYVFIPLCLYLFVANRRHRNHLRKGTNRGRTESGSGDVSHNSSSSNSTITKHKIGSRRNFAFSTNATKVVPEPMNHYIDRDVEGTQEKNESQIDEIIALSTKSSSLYHQSLLFEEISKAASLASSITFTKERTYSIDHDTVLDFVNIEDNIVNN